MKNVKSKLFFVGIVIIMAVISLLIRKAVTPHDVVLPAIGRAYAAGMVRENESYIVRITDLDDSGTVGWYYIDGEEKKDLVLSGRDPALELSYIFLQPDRNSFLVKGRIDERLTKDTGCLTLEVERWYLIAPIKRDYKSKEDREEKRAFYPRGYLDAYDLEQGDYMPLKIQREIGYYQDIYFERRK